MASYSIGGIILTGRKQDRRCFVFPGPVVQSSLRGHKDVKKDGDGAAGERPAKRELKAYELGFEILKSVDNKFP